MTTTAMFFWIAVTTIYGYIMHTRGYKAGSVAMAEMLVEASEYKNLGEVFQVLSDFYNKDEET